MFNTYLDVMKNLNQGNSTLYQKMYIKHICSKHHIDYNFWLIDNINCLPQNQYDDFLIYYKNKTQELNKDNNKIFRHNNVYYNYKKNKNLSVKFKLFNLPSETELKSILLEFNELFIDSIKILTFKKLTNKNDFIIKKDLSESYNYFIEILEYTTLDEIKNCESQLINLINEFEYRFPFILSNDSFFLTNNKININESSQVLLSKPLLEQIIKANKHLVNVKTKYSKSCVKDIELLINFTNTSIT